MTNRPSIMDNPSELNVFAVREDGLSFIQCAEEAIRIPELIEQFDRLYGANLSRKGSGLDLAIDKATGRFDSDFKTFMEFVWEFIFLRCPDIREGKR